MQVSIARVCYIPLTFGNMGVAIRSHHSTLQIMLSPIRKIFIPIAAMWISTSTLTRAADDPRPTGSAEFKGCHVSWNERELVIGNRNFERKWRIDNGLLTATSFRDLGANVEWLAKPAGRPAPYPAGALPGGKRVMSGVARSGRLNPVEEESLVLELATVGEASYAYRFQVFPSAGGVGILFNTGFKDAAEVHTKPGGGGRLPSGIEANPSKAISLEGDSLEDLLLSPPHVSFTQVTLRDQTDVHEQLVFENQWVITPNEGPLKLEGNVFFVEDTLTKAGLLFMKQAPLPHARPLKSEWDAQMLGGSRRLRFAGQGYPFTLLAYSGGRIGRIEALQIYQRQLRRYDPQRDGMFLSNTWGDRSRDARINEAFMLKEIEAGARLGVDVIQIDDGWQKGTSANSSKGKGVWNGYWAADPDFWQPNPQRFPTGLATVVKAAREKGMKFGLWYGPDSSNDASSWQRDADRILQLHKEHGIDYFKLDSVKAVSTATERNLRRFWDRVLEQSDGRVVFDLDVTAEIRPGYFGAPDVGPVFVENRYTDWRTYSPHQTLRNLWMLSQYVDPLRLRMEFLNNTRNLEKYRNDPLAPSCYQPDYLFASVMCANPLGWFEASNLPEDYITSVSKLVKVWKRERSQWFSGKMIPIGDAPDGTSWTGFASVGGNQRSGYLLVFRELNDESSRSLAMPSFDKGPHRLTTLAGNGSAELVGQQMTVSIPKPLDYLWLKVEPAD